MLHILLEFMINVRHERHGVGIRIGGLNIYVMLRRCVYGYFILLLHGRIDRAALVGTALYYRLRAVQ